MGIKQTLQKRKDYFFDSTSFQPVFTERQISQVARQTAAAIRGLKREPAIFIHGIMPRSGTVYTGELLRLHPALFAYPNDLWELPFLQQTRGLQAVANGFLHDYEENKGKIGESDFLPLFGAAFMAYLHSFAPPDRRLLVKMAGVHHLYDFFNIFPDEQLLVLVRDGRDVVESTLRSWPRLGFINVCRRWQRSADLILAFDKSFHGRQGYFLEKFEKVVKDPADFIQSAGTHFQLDMEAYPFPKIADLPVKGSSILRPEGDLSWAPITKPKKFNPVGRWQSWPRWKKSLFKLIAGRSLLAFGYCKDMNW